MVDQIKGYRIFIASPRGLDDIRTNFVNTIDEYNKSEAIPKKVLFQAIGWEFTLPGMGRPQEIINKEIRECDYFILVLWDQWGSPPGKKGTTEYTSGTEEEYHVALDCYHADDMPMRQIVVLFKAVDGRRLNDPGKQLEKVLHFKRQLEKKKKLLFKSFDDVERFEKILRSLLGQLRRDDEDGSIYVAAEL